MAAQPKRRGGLHGNISFMHNKVGDILKAQGFQQTQLSKEYRKSLAIMSELARKWPKIHPAPNNAILPLRSIASGRRPSRSRGQFYQAALDPYFSP